MLFFNTLMIGTLIAISSYSWFSMWMGLEINLLSFIPLMSKSENIYPSESALKYFMTQSLASSILLFSVVLMTNINEFIPQNPSYWLTMVMSTALLTKMGAAPFHAWFPEVLEGLSWMNCLILLTWQKIAPMILLLYNSKLTLFLTVTAILSSLTGSILGINQTSLRKIMGYSSINHMGWMIASMLGSNETWMIYFLLYTIISVSVISILHKLNVFQMKQLMNSLNQKKMFKFFFLSNFLSLGGLPPFVGFFPKWLVVNTLVKLNYLSLSLILILSTLIALFFYLRITFMIMTINTSETNTFESKYLDSLSIGINILSLGGLPICTLFLNQF
uniref:NADH-ubiquinone oxidoreductase chain 2 n=1 Tax=Epipedocera atra TaxID=2763313 RepID=A0A7G7WQ85_9CUCU|nr:NADH dehydrogenase subunit 2 [Epipedocera atra]QNH68712.1 NADH dehydrogenase subunit 2 [Epipedocera atra]